MALACPIVLPAECGLYLFQNAVLIHSCHRHLIGQVKMICEHIVPVMVSHCRRICDRGHLFRGKERRVLARFPPALVLHLVSR